MTLRGRADDAFARGDYREAVALYSELVDERPHDAEAKARLVLAERGLLGQSLDRAEEAQQRNREDGLRAALEALETADRLHAGSIDRALQERLDAVVEWTSATLEKSIEEETSRGRALAARARRQAYARWLARPELAALGPKLDAEIAAAGARTCARATEIASRGEQPYALELVASYCKEMGAPLPPWKPRPFLVAGVDVRGQITGTPAEERRELEQVVAGAFQRSVWFSPVASNRAVLELDGSVSASVTAKPTELARSWVEQVPYEATEHYREPVEVPYVVRESFLERVPYTTTETRLVPCPPPQTGTCSVEQPVTKMRTVTRTRPVTRYRTEWVDRTRTVTRMRDEPRVFRYTATKHEGRYAATFVATISLPDVPPLVARDAQEDARVAWEHDVEFAPAGVKPEHGTVPTALAWRKRQRERLGAELLRVLDAGWLSTFCSEGVETIEDAARCAHGRPSPAPNAVRTQIVELFGDDPDLVLSLPRPLETVTTG